MRHLNALSLAAVMALALTGLTTGSASATTLEVNGVPQNKAVAFTFSLEPGSTMFTGNTEKTLTNTCKKSVIGGTTEVPFSSENVTGKLTELTFEECTHGPMTVEEGGMGQIFVRNIPGTTNGTVFSENTKVTVPTSFPGTAHVTCVTAANGTHIGTLTGATTASNPSANATIDIKAVLSCGFLLPSALREASYVVTTPTELGSSA